MPRVNHVAKARKDIPNTDIKKGDSYYWWKFRYGGKRVSKTYPKRQQLTQSDFYIQVYDLEDEIAALEVNAELKDNVEDIATRIRDLADECEEKRSNMPDGLQDSDTGNLLQDRADALSAAADELEQIDFDRDEFEEEGFYEEEFDASQFEIEEGESQNDFEARVEDERKRHEDEQEQERAHHEDEQERKREEYENFDDDEGLDFLQEKLSEAQSVSIDVP